MSQMRAGAGPGVCKWGKNLGQTDGNPPSELVGWDGVVLVGKLFRFQLSESLALLCTFEYSNPCVRLLHSVKDRMRWGHNFVLMTHSEHYSKAIHIF